MKLDGPISTADLGRVMALAAALAKINAIRNSIIGLQTVNWSEHIYPLVAALEEAGYEGEAYPTACENVGTMLERVAKAEGEVERRDEMLAAADARVAELEAENGRLRARLRPLSRTVRPEVMLEDDEPADSVSKAIAFLESCERDGQRMAKEERASEMDPEQRAAGVIERERVETLGLRPSDVFSAGEQVTDTENPGSVGTIDRIDERPATDGNTYADIWWTKPAHLDGGRWMSGRPLALLRKLSCPNEVCPLRSNKALTWEERACRLLGHLLPGEDDRRREALLEERRALLADRRTNKNA